MERPWGTLQDPQESSSDGPPLMPKHTARSKEMKRVGAGMKAQAPSRRWGVIRTKVEAGQGSDTAPGAKDTRILWRQHKSKRAWP